MVDYSCATLDPLGSNPSPVMVLPPRGCHLCVGYAATRSGVLMRMGLQISTMLIAMHISGTQNKKFG